MYFRFAKMEGISEMRSHSVSVRRGVLAGIATCAALALAACGSSSSSTPSTSSSSPSSGASNPLAGGAPKGTVVVGSANFPEDELLAEIYSGTQGQGRQRHDKLNIGARTSLLPADHQRLVTILPEYNGALLATSVEQTSTAATTADVDAALTSGLPSSLEILNPLDRSGLGLGHGDPGVRQGTPPHLDRRPEVGRPDHGLRVGGGVRDAPGRDPRPQEELRRGVQVVRRARR